MDWMYIKVKGNVLFEWVYLWGFKEFGIKVYDNLGFFR